MDRGANAPTGNLVISLWNSVHSLELVWDHVCRCQEALSTPFTCSIGPCSAIVYLIAAVWRPAVRRNEVSNALDSSQHTIAPMSRAKRTLLQDIPFLMSFMRLPPDSASRLPSLRHRTEDEGERRGRKKNWRFCCVDFSLRATCSIVLARFFSLSLLPTSLSFSLPPCLSSLRPL